MRLIDADKFWVTLFNMGWFDNADRELALNSLLEAKTVDAEPVRHGRWEYGTILDHEWRKCSECLVSQTIFGCFTYCPNCGAKMDGDHDV